MGDDFEDVAINQEILSQRLTRVNVQLDEELPDFSWCHTGDYLMVCGGNAKRFRGLLTHADINPTRIVPIGPARDLNRPHGRSRLA